ncbi:Gamma-D-glutamyl-L-diamino acid endopeptidase 1 [uncultured Eubacterium sp.]|nr:Gamma-D-glutamyl-L-diamino acid endopeptidase 1 [uncultured Eubacterium sp.]
MNTSSKGRIAVILIVFLTIMTAISQPISAATSYIVSRSDKKYSYSDMRKDIEQLTAKYPDRLTSQVLGESADGRNIYALCLGNPEAEKQIFVTAGMHAREYINCQVVMMMLERYCRNYGGKYKGKTYRQLFDEVAVYIIPMVNPDGIAISQSGAGAIRNAALRKKVQKMPRRGGYSNWKSNARGVDLNHNYKMYAGKHPQRKPASDNYPGPSRFSESETKAVRDLMKSMTNMKACLNYHSMGQVIYWGYKNKSYKSKSYALAKLFKQMTGYYLIDESYTRATYGDLEHYVINEYRVPYVCIETGYGGVPVSSKQLLPIYKKLMYSFEKTAYMYR